MLPTIHVPTSGVGLAIAGVQCLNLAACFNEVKSPAPYSKFAKGASGKMVSSQVGMFIIYTPALVLAVYSLLTSPHVNGREHLVAALLVAHFAKRCVEVAAVHVYSGTMALATGTMIGCFYALLTALIVAMQRGVPAALYEREPTLGIVFFVVGQLGNLYHHWLLAQQRRGSKSKAYVIPTGGLFGSCTMPHYTFEITAWFGVALASQQINVFLVAAGMASYLSGRAVATSRWYEDKFGSEWAPRAHIAPGVF